MEDESGEPGERDETIAPPPTATEDEIQGDEEAVPEGFASEEIVTTRKRRKRRIYDENEEDEEVGEDDEDEDEDYDDLSDESSSVESEEKYNPLGAVQFEYEGQSYEFPSITNPGTIDGIFDKVAVDEEFDLTGRKRYLFVCKALRIAPCSRFYNGLNKTKIDLSFRGIHPKNVRGMCEALESNSIVELWNLQDNWLTVDACYHIGLMLSSNTVLTHLNLSGCRVGPEGMMKIASGLSDNFTLKVLNLSKNCIGNEGMKVLGPVLEDNKGVKVLDLSYNKLGGEAAEVLGSVFKWNEVITEIDLTWNDLYDAAGMKAFFKKSAENEALKKLILRWNAMSGEETAKFLGIFLKKNQFLEYLDLSDNRFDGKPLPTIRKGVISSRSLQVLKLGRNPFTAEDAESFLNGLANAKALRVLDFEDIWVKKSFMQILSRIQQTKIISVHVAGVYSKYEVKGCDYPKVILERARYEAEKPKKKKLKRDFGHLLWALGNEPVTETAFMEEVNNFKAKIDMNLFPELIKQFKAPRNMIDVVGMRQKYLSMYPDSKPAEPKKKKEKGKKEDVAVEHEEPKIEQTPGKVEEKQPQPEITDEVLKEPESSQGVAEETAVEKDEPPTRDVAEELPPPPTEGGDAPPTEETEIK